MAPDLHLPIDGQIRLCNGHPTLLASDLATLYGVSTRALLDCIRSHGPAPGEYVFIAEVEEPSGEPEPRRGAAGYVFTEHGAIAAAYMLGTETAMRESVEVLRAFVRYRARSEESAQRPAPAQPSDGV